MTIWLASYPKSGSTWLRLLVGAHDRDDDVDLASGSTHEAMSSKRTLTDAVLEMPTGELTAAEINEVRPLIDDAYARRPGATRLRKVHDHLPSGPDGAAIVSLGATEGAIYFMRDPRDVALSFAHHLRRDVERVVEMMGDDDASIGSTVRDAHEERLASWSTHVRGWVDQSLFPVHVVRYEDAVTDPIGTFGAALSFMGMDLDDARLQRAIDRTSFHRLQAQERVTGFSEAAPGVAFFRRGVEGAWRDELEPALVARIEATHGEVMQRFGYELTMDTVG
jgi:aryl sulfotransferase